jgi:abhydrolase domain-containing protein 6
MSDFMTTAVEVNGHACRVWKKGAGPKLGFLAGLGGLPKWIPFLDELAKTREVIVPSLPGFPGATGHRELDTHLDWVLAARDLLRGAGLEGADLVGSSVGGGLAAEVAAIWPESVRRLALIAPFGVFNANGHQADPWAQRPDTLAPLVSAHPELFVELKKAPEGCPDPAEWAIEQMRATEASARLFFPLGDRGLAKRLHRITAPTLLVWGSEDRMLPPGHADFFVTSIRVGKELRIIRGAGHLAELDEPRETAAAVLQWVRHAG